MIFNFTSYQERQEVSASGEYVRIVAADFPVEVWGDDRLLQTIVEGQQVKANKEFKRLALVNTGNGANAVEVQVGYGELAGNEVTIAGQPTVKIAPNQQVEIPAVTIAPDQHVIVDEMPDITVNHSHTVNVPEFEQPNESPDTPDVPIGAGQTVLIHDPAVYECDTVEFYSDIDNVEVLRVWPESPDGTGAVIQGGYLYPMTSGKYSGRLKIYAHNASDTEQIINLVKTKVVSNA
ncbi:MAG: hypothetical protein ACPGMR_11480 [Pontibacterium sp.]